MYLRFAYSNMTESFVRTKGSLARKDAEASLRVVKYEAPRPRARRPSDGAVGPDVLVPIAGPRDQRKGIDIKRARRELIKFGISGMSAEEQQQAKVALAVSLGARPPKKENTNYKELQKQKKRDKLKAKKMAEFQQAGKNAVGASTAKKKFIFGKATTGPAPSGKKKNRDLLDSYGKVSIDTAKSKSSFSKAHKPKKNA